MVRRIKRFFKYADFVELGIYTFMFLCLIAVLALCIVGFWEAKTSSDHRSNTTIKVYNKHVETVVTGKTVNSSYYLDTDQGRISASNSMFYEFDAGKTYCAEIGIGSVLGSKHVYRIVSHGRCEEHEK